MKGVATVLLVICCCCLLYAQEVDLVRLGYSESELTSKQIGLAASPDGKYIAFIYEDKTIKIFDVVAGRFIKRFSGPYASLVDVHLTSNGRISIISGREAQVWDWKTGKNISTFTLLQEASKTAYSRKT